MEICAAMTSEFLRLFKARGNASFLCFDGDRLWIEDAGNGAIATGEEAMNFALRLRGGQSKHRKLKIDAAIGRYLQYQ